MHEFDLNRVVFYSKEDMAGGHQLQKGELILRNETNSNYTDINDILELYNIKKYIDNELFLKSWTQEDISNFRLKVTEYGKIAGKYMANVNDNNIIDLYKKAIGNYEKSFWEIVNNQYVFKRVSKDNFKTILTSEPRLVYTILCYKNIVEHYNIVLKDFLLTYSLSAEILLTVYEVKDEFNKNQMFIPKSLTIQDKENIISNYLESNDTNLNYVGIIQNVRNKNDFKISDKTRLKAKRLYKSETERFFMEKKGMEYGVSVSFPENASKVKDGFVDDNHTIHYSYSLDFIKKNNDPYILFQNFKYLFEYLDNQNMINLVSKKSKMNLFESIMGVHSQSEYSGGMSFSLSEMVSQDQILGYSKIVKELNYSLEDILHFIFTSVFQKKYDFDNNARFSIPTATSYFEKVRLLAPEFESVLKQFKLFVEDGNIDFELLQISSTPSAIKGIPSLNQKKYIYFNENNQEMVGCTNLFFSNQTLLTFVEPFREKHYHNFFDLLVNEEEVIFNNYEEHQKPQINYLIDKGFISIDNEGLIQIKNIERLLILKDLYDNEAASFYHYPIEFQKEAQQMENEKIIFFESTLFSKPEQAYFNYFLNKSEFTNGLDLRNSYLHGTQANPEEIQRHEYAYFTYLKLLFLAFLKIEDDLEISKKLNNRAQIENSYMKPL